MQRDESSANPPSHVGDSVNPNTGTGASGPGDPTYDRESQTGDIDGEAQIDLEEKRRRMAAGEPGADPAEAAGGGPPQPNPDLVSDEPEVQQGS